MRLTIIGQTLYCVEITDQGHGIEGDWRLLGKCRLRYEDHLLPEEEKQRCVDLVKALGLKFGAIDMARTPAGSYFIEINPTGEWGWLDCPSRPIASDIARLLSETGS
jgi:glutathione synthase/RimK-type ligase-like ATP-grasp enzyme